MRHKSLLWVAIFLGFLRLNGPVSAEEVILKVGKADITKETQNLVTTFTSNFIRGKSTGWKPVIEKVSPKEGRVFLIVECTLEGKGKKVSYDHEKDFILMDGEGNKSIGYSNTGNYYTGGKGAFAQKKQIKMKLLYSIPEKITEPLKIIYGDKEYPVTIAAKK
jgi:hypothetical protein